MTSRTRSTALGIAGLVATLAAGAAVVWGRVRSVDVPRHGQWSGVALVCAADGVHRRDVVAAVADAADHGHTVRLLPAGSDCTPRDGLVVVRVDPALDVGTGLGDGWGGDAIVLEDTDDTGTVWGRTHVQQLAGGRILRADVRLHPSQSALSTTHELLHALGWGHPDLAPTGHVLHPTAPSLDDWRGVRGP